MRSHLLFFTPFMLRPQSILHRSVFLSVFALSSRFTSHRTVQMGFLQGEAIS